MGLICHFLKVPNCVGFNIFRKYRDVEISVRPRVLMNSTWEIVLYFEALKGKDITKGMENLM